MKKRAVLLMLAMVLLAWGPSVHAAAIDFDLIPAGGIVSGPAGSTLGWGYAITNNEGHDLWIDGIAVASSANGTPDTLVFDYPYILAESFVSANHVPGVSGLFEFTWNAGLPAGTTEINTITLYGLLGPDQEPVELTATWTATVSQAVPEPGTVILLGGGLLGLAGFRRKR